MGTVEMPRPVLAEWWGKCLSVTPINGLKKLKLIFGRD